MMSLSRRVEVLEQHACAQRTTDTAEPPWAAPLFDCEMDATQVYHAWGAVLDAIAAGRCVVRARRLVVDYLQPGASQEVCDVLQKWLDYLNDLWESGRRPPDEKPVALADYTLWLLENRAEMAFWSTMSPEEGAILTAAIDTADPTDDPPLICQEVDARYQAWCVEVGAC